jgi:hypothetical protein
VTVKPSLSPPVTANVKSYQSEQKLLVKFPAGLTSCKLVATFDPLQVISELLIDNIVGSSSNPDALNESVHVDWDILFKENSKPKKIKVIFFIFISVSLVSQ